MSFRNSDNKEFARKLFALAKVQEGREEIYKKIYILPFELDETDFIKFLEELLKYPDGIEAIRKKWRILLNNSREPLKTLEVYRKNADIEKEVVNDIPYLIKYSNIDDAGVIAKELEMFEGGKEAIANNFDSLLQYTYTNLDSIFCSALETKEGMKKAKENFKYLKENATADEFFRFIDRIENMKEFKEESEKYTFWKNLYKEVSFEPPEFPNSSEIYELSTSQIDEIKQLRVASDRINFEFETLIKSEDLEEKKMVLEAVSNGNPFEYLSHGSSSIVFRTGEQVIKFGIGDNEFKIPYHPRIMMPYFRKQYLDGSMLEVYNLGIVESAKITDEQLLSIYKELEEAGILWGDARKVNLVVLKKDNNLPDFIKSEDFNLFGFLEDSRFPTNNHVALKKGDIVICDLYYLYAKDNPDYGEGLPDEIIQKYIADKKRKEAQEEEK